MSTYVYLACLEHTPPLVADEESEQHLTLDAIRADLANRDLILKAVEAGYRVSADDYFRDHTVGFLVQHPRCRIGIRDEHGRWYATTGDNDNPIPPPAEDTRP